MATYNVRVHPSVLDEATLISDEEEDKIDQLQAELHDAKGKSNKQDRMLQQVRLLDWLLEIDREATISAYCQASTQDCDCAYCRNYRQACVQLPFALLHVLDTLGIDPSRPTEAIEYCENEDGTHFYSGMYNVVGRIIDGPDYRSMSEATGPHGLYRMAKDLKIGFTSDVCFRLNFSEPIFQTEFFVNLPWVLAEKP